MEALGNFFKGQIVCFLPFLNNPSASALPVGYHAGVVASVMPLGTEPIQDGITRTKLCFVELSSIYLHSDFYLGEK